MATALTSSDPQRDSGVLTAVGLLLWDVIAVLCLDGFMRHEVSRSYSSKAKISKDEGTLMFR